MGNWVETCILSKLPIKEKEHCVMLVGKNTLYNIFNINKVKSMFVPLPLPDMHIYKGVYEGGGTLEDMEDLEEIDKSIFVNKDVWNWLIQIFDDLELARTKQSHTEDFEEHFERFPHLNRPYIWEYMKVSYSASLLKLVPNSLILKGATEYRLEEFGLWLKLLTNLNNSKIEAEKELYES